MIEPPPDHLAEANAETRRMSRGMSLSFVRDLVVSGILPWLCVYLLGRNGVPLVTALWIATLIPIADGTFSFVVKHRLSIIGIINLAFLLASIALAFVSGDYHLLLLKGALLTGVFSLLCLGSLLTPKPLMFYIGRQVSTGDDPVRVAEWNARWELPRFRNIIRLITVVWGIGYLFEVAARIVITYTLPLLTVVALNPVITYGMLGLLMTWTILYGGAMRRKYAAAATPAAGIDRP
jgi:hypothetical protein